MNFTQTLDSLARAEQRRIVAGGKREAEEQTTDLPLAKKSRVEEGLERSLQIARMGQGTE